MSAEASRQIIETKLKAFWGSRTPLVLENRKYTPTNGVSFIKSQIEWTSSEIKGISCQREHYILIIEVYTPSNLGTKENLTACDDLIKAFFGYAEGFLTCFGGRSQRVGSEREWYRRDTIIDFTYDNNF